jgi:hypothetical protein
MDLFRYGKEVSTPPVVPSSVPQFGRPTAAQAALLAVMQKGMDNPALYRDGVTVEPVADPPLHDRPLVQETVRVDDKHPHLSYLTHSATPPVAPVLSPRLAPSPLGEAGWRIVQQTRRKIAWEYFYSACRPGRGRFTYAVPMEPGRRYCLRQAAWWGWRWFVGLFSSITE